MKTPADEINSQDTLLRVLSAHFRSLVAAESSEKLLSDYSRLLRFMRHSPQAIFGHEKESTRRPYEISEQLEQKLLSDSLDDLEVIIDGEDTPRAILEFLAISRFSVPKGSMRSYSNRHLLTEKLRNLLRNERAHLTIGALARNDL